MFMQAGQGLVKSKDPLQWVVPHYIIVCGSHVGGQPEDVAMVIPLCAV